MSAVPPSAAENRLAPTAARVHRMRVARGACWVIVAALLAGAGLTLLDSISPLPALIRGLALAAWVTGIGVLVWRLVARRLPSDADTKPWHARAELPGNMRAAAAAAAALAASLLAATLVPGAGEHIRRVALPWSRTTGPLHYRVKVTSGELVVRRGDSVTLSAYAEKLDSSAATPDSAMLVCRDRTRSESRLPMAGDGNGAFHAVRSGVAAGFEYRIEIGSASSDWVTVTALDPVELTAQSTIEVVPPRYAPAVGKSILAGFTPFEGTQHSTVEFRLRFSRPTGGAFLEWRADGGAPLEPIPVALAPDKLSGAASFRLIQDGSLKLVTVAEENGKSLRTEFPVRVRAIPDAPPRFERIQGLSPRARTARPGTRVPVEFTATDDMAVGSAAIEYHVGSDEIKVASIPVPLTGANTNLAQGRLDFDLTGKAREGEMIRFRVRVFDTRRLDELEIRPQETVYPETGWSVLRIDSSAAPLDEQDILAQRDVLGEALLAALGEVKSAQRDASKVRADAAGKTTLPLELTVRLNNTREVARRVADALRKASSEAGLTIELRSLAKSVREVADLPTRNGEEALKKAATDNTAERDSALTVAIESLNDGIVRLDKLIAANHNLAQARLDRKTIANLASDQAAIANLARPEGTTPTDELARLQRELFARLRKLISESEPLRVATELAKQHDLRRLALTTRELAGFLRDLDAAAKHLDTNARKELLRSVAGEQGILVSSATVLVGKAETAARLLSVELPKTAQFVRVSDLILEGKTVEALTELEERAQGLDAIATAIEKWVADHRDPKVAARQLGLWQDDIRTRFRAATKDDSAKFADLPFATKVAFQREQLAVQHAVLVLRFPPNDELKKLHGDLFRQVSNGTTLLGMTGLNADVVMKHATDGFNKLAEKIPTIPERLMKARNDFVRMQVTQDAILFSVEQAVRANDSKRLPALVEQQLQQVGAFRALDIPGQESRANCIAVALASAVADLRDALPGDALATQQWLKREFDRLKLVLDGLAAPDDRAEELARKLDALVKAIDALGPSPIAKQLEVRVAEAQELARQVALFGLPLEAPALGNDARQAAIVLEVAARDPKTKLEELRKRTFVLAEAMAKLSDRLNGQEPDFDRVRRLSASRWAAVREAQLSQGKPPNPDVSGEAARQLVREAEELSFTRVGHAGQAQKKKILDLSGRLKEQTAPDRQYAQQKAIAESLDELASVMADLEWLTTPINRTPRARPVTDADNYLPTSALAETFRDLARKQRALRGRITNVTAEVKKLVTPSANNALAEIERKQRDLAAEITAFARKLEADKETAAAETVLQAAIHATLAADGIAVGMTAPANGSGELAGNALRRVATSGGVKPYVKTAADLAARQDVIRGELGPRLAFPPGVIAAQQKTRGEELARRAAELAVQLELAARASGAQEPSGQVLLEAAKEASAVEKQIAQATRKGADGQLAEASKLRTEAATRLAGSAEKVAAIVPTVAVMPNLDPNAVKAAEALRRAEAAMREALEVLEPKPDRSAAERAMRAAAEALSIAARARFEMVER